jgi:hypothetical protein
VSSELFHGLPATDLLERDGFVRDQLRELDALLPVSRRIALVVGAVLPVPPRDGKHLANCAAVLLRVGGGPGERDAAPHLRRLREAP